MIKIDRKQYILFWKQNSLPSQLTPASSLWSQFALPHPLWGHRVKEASLPLHLTSSSSMFPDPDPKNARVRASPPENPSCRQTTFASSLSQESSHTVPHAPPQLTSTRPSRPLLPPLTKRMVCDVEAVRRHWGFKISTY